MLSYIKTVCFLERAEKITGCLVVPMGDLVTKACFLAMSCIVRKPVYL